MPLQNSGPISLSNIQSEFGGTNPISLSEYRGDGGTPVRSKTYKTSTAPLLHSPYPTSSLVAAVAAAEMA